MASSYSPTFVMENHSTALAYWKRVGCSGAHVIHLDTHSDVGWVSPTRLAAIRPAQGADILRHEMDTLTYTTPGLFDITNFLSVAFELGIVNSLTWIVPDGLWQSWELAGDLCDTVRRNLATFTQGIDPQAADALYEHNGVLRVQIPYGELTICRLGSLPPPPPDRPLLLDVDIDFMIEIAPNGADRVWITPVALDEALRARNLRPLCTTISCSVNGGYTPRSCKGLAAETFRLLSGESRFIAAESPMTYRAEEIPDRFPPPEIRNKPSYQSHVLGTRAMVRQDFELARALLESAVTQDPDIPGYHYIYALALQRCGNPKDAVRAYRRALALQAEMFLLFNDLGILLAQSGQLDEAITLLERAVSLNPTAADTVCNLGCVYAAAGERDLAMATLEQALDLNPIHPRAASQLGALLAPREPQRAKAYLSRAARFTPDRLTALMAEREARKIENNMLRRDAGFDSALLDIDLIPLS
jgi:Tfp pilus assembly protein PilF